MNKTKLLLTSVAFAGAAFFATSANAFFFGGPCDWFDDDGWGGYPGYGYGGYPGYGYGGYPGYGYGGYPGYGGYGYAPYGGYAPYNVAPAPVAAPVTAPAVKK